MSTVLSVKLVYRSIIQVEAISQDGIYEFSLHPLDPVIGNLNGRFSFADRNFSRSAGDVRLEDSALHARLADGSNGWLDQSLQVKVHSVDNSSTGVQVQLYESDQPPRTVEKLALPKFSPDKTGKSWGFLHHANLAILFRENPARTNTQMEHVDLNSCVGNEQGEFDLTSKNFLDSARNVALRGRVLSADLLVNDNIWKHRTMNVKGLVDSRLSLRDPVFHQFDDGSPRQKFRRQPLAHRIDPPTQPLYDPLDRSRNGIRVCEIRPGEWSEPIVCRFKLYEGESKKPYQCLSYAWGDATNTVPIIVNGHEFNATFNLAMALLQLRRRADSLPIWIDAICINQSNNEEKSWQVAKMNEIYSEAEKVIFWLGGGDVFVPKDNPHQDFDSAVFSFERICRHLYDGNHFCELPGLFDNVKKLKPGPKYYEIFCTLRTLDRAPWWYRAWTYQEIILPERVVCLIGPLEVPWETLSRASLSLLQHTRVCPTCSPVYDKLDPKVKIPLLSWATEVDLLRMGRKEFRGYTAAAATNQHSTLKDWKTAFTLLNFCRFRKSFDPRDKVYGVLAMTPSAIDASFLPNYTHSVAKVYTDFTLHVINSTHSLSIWDHSFNENRNEAQTSPAGPLPSWVVDWISPTIVANQTSVQLGRSHECLFPSAPTLGTPVEVLHESERDLLILEGTQIDTVAAVHEPFLPAPTYSNQGNIAVADLLRGWREFILGPTGEEEGEGEGEKAYPSDAGGGKLEEIFWRILMNDHLFADLTYFEDGRRTRRLEQRDFEAWEEWFEGALDGKPTIATTLGRGKGKIEETAGHMIWSSVQFAMESRRLFRTGEGYVGLGPTTVREGDGVWGLVGGGKWVHVLREVDWEEAGKAKNVYKLVGPGYLHGIMDGEVQRRVLEGMERVYLA